MKSVSRFEANLLSVLRSLLQHGPREKALALVMRQSDCPPCLSRAAVELIEDHLRKGIVHHLAQTGWRTERHLRDSQVRTGRLWERTPPEQLGLTFSRHSLLFLLWLMSASKKEEKPTFLPAEDELTIGDRLLFFLAFQALHAGDAGAVLARQPCFQRDGLIRLAFANVFGDSQAALAWHPWMDGIGSVIFEALQVPLRERWLEMEQAKEQADDWKLLISLGRGQETVLRGLTDTLMKAGRFDLARFLFSALGQLLEGSPSARRWLGKVNLDALRMAERQTVQHSALALVRQLDVLRLWHEQARTVGFFDEGYAASQLWKADWEAGDGDDLCRRARVLLRQIEPI